MVKAVLVPTEFHQGGERIGQRKDQLQKLQKRKLYP